MGNREFLSEQKSQNLQRSSDIEGRQARFACVFTNEWDKHCTQVYNYNFHEQVIPADIRKVEPKDIPDFDLLCGGFPCQSFSIAGQRKGFDDTRGTMFFEIARILEAKRPEMVLLENVKGLLSHDRGRTFHRIIEVLAELGYVGQYEVLNSKNFGVPQNRERVFVFCVRGERRFQVFPLGGCDKENSGMEQGKKVIDMLDSDREISRVYSPEGLAPTLHLKTGGWQEPKIACFDGMKIRRLTPIECERLQGFPDGWTRLGILGGKAVEISDTQRYKMMGNAVTVNVIEAIGKQILLECGIADIR